MQFFHQGAIMSTIVTSNTPATVADYIDPSFQLGVPFGSRSWYSFPWRAYSDTFPTSWLIDSVGINLNIDSSLAENTCRHLAEHGFRHVRIEVGWVNFDFNNPSVLTAPSAATLATTLNACKRHGLRPMFLLNAHQGAPCPWRSQIITLAADAPVGATKVSLSPNTDYSQIVYGKTGFSNLTDYWAAEVLITSFDKAKNTATLSRPLPVALAAGDHACNTLKFQPFSDVFNAESQKTWDGWVTYAHGLAQFARGILGTATDCGFDFETWNELTFGSLFLDINNYYSPSAATSNSVWGQICNLVVAFTQANLAAYPKLKVTNGISNTVPWPASSYAPIGLHALSKHPYRDASVLPADAGAFSGTALNAEGQPDSFTPTFTCWFPEYYLHDYQTETTCRDISPITDISYSYAGLHGRYAGALLPDGTHNASTVWLTEFNLNPTNLSALNPSDTISLADADHMKAKCAIRTLAAFTAKGVERVYFFCAQDGSPTGLGLVSNAFLAMAAGAAYPVDQTVAAPVTTTPVAAPVTTTPVAAPVTTSPVSDAPGNGSVTSPVVGKPIASTDGPASAPVSAASVGTIQVDGATSEEMAVVARFVASIPASSITKPRALQVVGISDTHGHIQYAGDPATASQTPDPHPTVYNRDCVAFFPFQSSDTAWACLAYVMTRSIGTNYGATKDVTRFDMPEEHYQITVSGLNGLVAKLAYYDPMTNTHPYATVIARTATTVTVDLPLTDSPRVLKISEG
jgi:hypothetical protein